MPVPIGEFVAALHRLIPGWQAAEWDPSGLQLGDPIAPAEDVGACHEVTEQVVAVALDAALDLLVTYHPLLFRPTNRLVAGRSPIGRAFRLVAGGVGLAVVHTSFDVAEGGTADALAEAVGLLEVRRFGPVDPIGRVKIVTFAPAESVEGVAAAMAAAGAGTVGNYSACSYRIDGIGAFDAGEGAEPVVGSKGAVNREPETRIEMIAPASARDHVCAALVAAHPYEEPAFDVYEVRSNLGFIGRIGMLSDATTLSELASRLASRLVLSGVRTSGQPATPVRQVAVVPGSGGSFVGAARAVGADVLVTGDVGHHTVVQALDAGLAVIDLGHTSSERPGMAALAATVSRLATDTGARFHDMTGLDPTPWQ